MAYTIEAILGDRKILHEVQESYRPAILVLLPQDLALIPMTDELCDAATDGTDGGLTAFWKLPGGFDRVLSSWSMRSPVAYVEAEYFGSVGQQAAAVWADGSLVLGPVVLAEDMPEPEAGTPISQA